jgi:hypothetical protein
MSATGLNNFLQYGNTDEITNWIVRGCH